MNKLTALLNSTASLYHRMCFLTTRVVYTTAFTLSLSLILALGIAAQSQAATVCFPVDGCTGTSTTPTTNSVLIGNSNGRYDVKTLTAGSGVTISNSGSTLTVSASSGGSFPFTPQSYGNSTSTTIGFLNGLFSVGSTTVSGLSTGLVGNNNGLLYGLASSSIFGFIPVNPTRAINTTLPLSGGGDLSADRTLSITQSGSATDGYLSSTDWNTFNNKISSTSLSATYPVQYNSGTGVFSLAFGTTTSNTWAGTQTFTNAPILGTLSGLVGANNGTLYQIATSTNFVTSIAAGSGISLSGSVGAVTITNTIGYPFPSNATSTQLTFNGGVITTGATSTASLSVTGSTTISSVLNVGGQINANGGLSLTCSGCITNTNLQNSSITINGSSVSLGGSITVASTTLLGDRNTYSALQTITFASTTAITASGELVIPSGTSKGSTVAGQIELDTTDNQLKVGDGTNIAIYSQYRNLTGEHATTTWTGTSTTNQIVAPFAGTLKDIQCKSPTGTLNTQVKVGSTNVLPMLNASSTVGTVTFTSSNTFNRGDIIEFDFGTPASSPTFVTCTARATETGT